MEFQTLKLFTFSSSFRFFLPLNARFVVMLTLFYLGENTVFCDGTLEAAKCSINRFIFANFRFRHQFSLPPTITHNPIQTRDIKLHYMLNRNRVSTYAMRVFKRPLN